MCLMGKPMYDRTCYFLLFVVNSTFSRYFIQEDECGICRKPSTVGLLVFELQFTVVAAIIRFCSLVCVVFIVRLTVEELLRKIEGREPMIPQSSTCTLLKIFFLDSTTLMCQVAPSHQKVQVHSASTRTRTFWSETSQNS